MEIRPLQNYVVIHEKEVEAEATTSSGIIVNSAHIDEPVSKTGDVISVGPEVKSVKEGDRVMFKEHGFEEVYTEDREIGGKRKKYRVGREEGIFAVVV